MKMLVFNPDKCTGCRVCETACSARKSGQFNPAKARIHVVDFGDFCTALACLQCSEPPCALICPSGVFTKDETTGIVEALEEKCIGCKMCLLACPFGCLTYLLEEANVVKCDLCGGDPECVKWCVTGALEIKEVDIFSSFKGIGVAEKLREIHSIGLKGLEKERLKTYFGG